MNHSLSGWIRKKSLRELIVIMFVVEILSFSVALGYVFYNSSLNTITESATRISSIVNDDITKMVQNYLDEPYHMEQINQNVMLNNQINFSDQNQRDKHFVEMLKVFPHVVNTYFVLASGYEYGARREDDGNFVVWNSDKEKKTLDYYKYDGQSGRQGYLKTLPSYDPTARPAYLKAVELKKPGWTDVYYSATGRGFVITKTCPVYATDGNLLGVHSCSMLLSWFDKFLKSLTVTDHSSVYILTGNEGIIASSDRQTEKGGQQATLTAAADNPLLAQGLKALKAKDMDANTIYGDAELMFSYNGEKYFLHAAPIQGKNDLQWKSVILIPEKDLTSYLHVFSNQLIIITVIACILALITGVLTARYIIKPIDKVNQVARRIAQGDFSDKIDVERQDEIGQLIDTVNEMSTKLEAQLELEKKAVDAEKKLREQGAALNQAAGSFVPYHFLYMLGKQDILGVTPGDYVEKELTILFTDIRSYTKISENMSNNELFQFVNRYLDMAVDVITINNGFIDKFIGDAVMALFPDGGDDALRAIIELRREMQQRGFSYNDIPVQIGAGIHFGGVTLGTVGTYTRMDTTVLGDSVNLASRLESATKVYGVDILLSEPCFSQLQHPDQFHIREVDTVKVKGKSQPIKLYEVFDGDPDELKQLKISTASLFAQGLDLYKVGDFARAEEIFRQCQQLCPGDHLIPVYIKRCGTLQRVPPGPDWKGVSGI